MDDLISVGLLIAAGVFLTFCAAIAYHSGADFLPTVVAVFVTFAAHGLAGLLWHSARGLFTVPTYFIASAAVSWWSWWDVLRSIAANIAMGVADKGLLARALHSPSNQGVIPLSSWHEAVDPWYTTWQFRWGVELLLVGLLVAFYMLRSRRNYYY